MPDTPNIYEQFWVRTPIQPAESLRGYLSRNRFNGDGCLHAKLKLHIPTFSHSGGPYLSNVRTLSRLLAPGIPEYEELLKKHTIYPLVRPFLNEPNEQRVQAHFLEQNQPGIAAILGVNNSGEPYRWQLGICLDCVKEDLARLGFTYWRTAHSIPGIYHCIYHEKQLYTYCGLCVYGQQITSLNVVPRSTCFCKEKLRPLPRHADARVGIPVMSDFMRKFMAVDTPEQWNSSLILKAIHARACELFGTADISPSTLQPLVEKKLGVTTASNYQLTTKHTAKLIQAVQGKALRLNFLQTCFLLIVLFDSFDFFFKFTLKVKEGLDSNSDVPSVKLPSKYGWGYRQATWGRLDKQGLKEATTKFRKHALLLSSRFPTETRGRLTQKEPGTFQFLRAYDNSWLDKHFPITPRGYIKKDRVEDQDSTLSEHIYSTYQSLAESEVSFRISRRRLLLNSSRRYLEVEEIGKLPLTKAAIEMCAEPRFDIRMRTMRSIAVRNRKIAGFPTIPKAWADLTDEDVEEFLLRIKKWKK